jgi:hypothetical protein
LKVRLKMAERVGFEPTVLNKEHTGFRNQLDQPLRHLSGAIDIYYLQLIIRVKGFIFKAVDMP